MSTERNKTSSRHSRREDTNCGKCDKDVGKKDHGLKCDMCELWHHTTCEGVAESLYKAIQDAGTDKSQGLHWYCKKCNRYASGFMAGLKRLSARQDALEEKVSDFEAHVTKKLKEVDASHEELAQKLDTVVAETANIGIKEMEDRESRKLNVILFGVQESLNSDPEGRKDDEKLKADDIFRNGLFCEVGKSQTRRLGAKREDKVEKEKGPLPLLVKVDNIQQA